jgi:metal-dependent amidase/aminoacylase/carboxypeptidase family protein
MGNWGEAINATIDEMAETLRAVRRHLHAHPEPSLEEYETTRYRSLAGLLEASGIPHRLIPLGRGIVAGPETAPEEAMARVAIRADIDERALAIGAKVLPRNAILLAKPQG